MNAQAVRSGFVVLALTLLLAFSYVTIAQAGLLDDEYSAPSTEASKTVDDPTADVNVGAGTKENPIKVDVDDACSKDPKCNYCGVLEYESRNPLTGNKTTKRCRRPSDGNTCTIPPGNTLEICSREDSINIITGKNKGSLSSITYCNSGGTSCIDLSKDDAALANVMGALNEQKNWGNLGVDDILPDADKSNLADSLLGSKPAEAGLDFLFKKPSPKESVFGGGTGSQLESPLLLATKESPQVLALDSLKDLPGSTAVGGPLQPVGFFSEPKVSDAIFGTPEAKIGNNSIFSSKPTLQLNNSWFEGVKLYTGQAWQVAKKTLGNWGFGGNQILAADPIISSPIVNANAGNVGSAGTDMPLDVQQALSDIGATHNTPVAEEGAILATLKKGSAAVFGEPEGNNPWWDPKGGLQKLGDDLSGAYQKLAGVISPANAGESEDADTAKGTGFEGSPEVGPTAAEFGGDAVTSGKTDRLSGIKEFLGIDAFGGAGADVSGTKGQGNTVDPARFGYTDVNPERFGYSGVDALNPGDANFAALDPSGYDPSLGYFQPYKEGFEYGVGQEAPAGDTPLLSTIKAPESWVTGDPSSKIYTPASPQSLSEGSTGSAADYYAKVAADGAKLKDYFVSGKGDKLSLSGEPNAQTTTSINPARFGYEADTASIGRGIGTGASGGQGIDALKHAYLPGISGAPDPDSVTSSINDVPTGASGYNPETGQADSLGGGSSKSTTGTGFEGSPEVGPKAAQIIHEDALVLNGGVDEIESDGTVKKGNKITVATAKDFFGDSGEGTKLTNYIGDRTIDTVVKNGKGKKEDQSFSADGAYYTRDGDEIKPNKMGGVTVREAGGAVAGEDVNVYGERAEDVTLGEALARVQPSVQLATEKSKAGDKRNVFQKWFDYTVKGKDIANPGDALATRGAYADFFASGYSLEEAERVASNADKNSAAYVHLKNDVYNRLESTGRLPSAFTGKGGRNLFMARMDAMWTQETTCPTCGKLGIWEGGSGLGQLTKPAIVDVWGSNRHDVRTDESLNMITSMIYYNKLALKYDGDLNKATAAYYSGSPVPKNTKYHTAAQIVAYQNNVNKFTDMYLGKIYAYARGEDGDPLNAPGRYKAGSQASKTWEAILKESSKYADFPSATAEEVAAVHAVDETAAQRAARIADAAAKSVTAGVESAAQVVLGAGQKILGGALQQFQKQMANLGKQLAGGNKSGGGSGGDDSGTGTDGDKDTPLVQRPALNCSPDTIVNDNQEKVTLRWTCYGDASSAYGINFDISSNGDNVGPAAGSLELMPASTADGWLTYGVGCKPAQTKAERTCLVRVLHPNVLLSAATTTVVSGERAQLAWSAYDVERCAVYGPEGSRVALGDESGTVPTEPLVQKSEFGIVCKTKTGFITPVATTTISVIGDNRDALPVSIPDTPDFTEAQQ